MLLSTAGCERQILKVSKAMEAEVPWEKKGSRYGLRVKEASSELRMSERPIWAEDPRWPDSTATESVALQSKR